MPDFNTISVDFYAVLYIKVFNLHLFCVISMFVSGSACIKDLNALRILMNFLCINLGEKGGGVAHVALMHVYMWEHIVSLY